MPLSDDDIKAGKVTSTVTATAKTSAGETVISEPAEATVTLNMPVTRPSQKPSPSQQ